MVLARNKQVGIAGRKSSCYCYCLNSYDMTVSNELRLIKPRSKIFGPFRMEHSSFKLTYSSSTAGNWSLFPFKREPSHSGLLCINWTFLTVIMSTISQLDTRLHAERNVTGMGKEGRAMPSIAQSRSADTMQAWSTSRLITLQHSCCFNKTFPLRRNN